MLSRLIRDAQRVNDPLDLNGKASRYLVQCFRDGTCDEGRLKFALKQFIARQISLSSAVDQWDDEGGATKKENR